MKSDFQAKFLQHLLDKQEEQGFTLIELLVVIIIIGILSAIALPSFLNQANKAKQSEAKTYVGSMNRAQQAALMERGSFTSDVSTLGLGIATQTENYAYGLHTQADATAVSNRAGSLQVPLRSYLGITWLGQVGSATVSEVTSLAVMCESEFVGKFSPNIADINNPTGFSTALPARPNSATNIICAGTPSATEVKVPDFQAKPWRAIK
ncbi:type IV pilin-like G/H family protein [Desertifilum sp. FACHB-1129]|uniref:General secretion pathway protein GspH n=2 Tax=Desertifilum tharense IPPAS B-1220 TaxID=1781255 RepID=A0A1E5QJ12_9CYAN|nr:MULTISPECIES: type IV pilin-like G/H family protein [Desertifilum]MDA0210561.1 type IV pilin-like G/H family protein [Cyanobacteria bacterium FC1]MBD2311562.1 type IV pilin-like G/H family protein [Desertifilum sp. FACHB-1129]MBD2323136.1 type IV pilin-like G/H family protein [Desertifilum sp. FACHB-866]MBD2332981.1 type IV pilin-like G/H family protein [Desertifilum sp. FACHB-868]OEJ74584.1 hypothetical protein BH720_14020 [Desertifilum tharense IPPAS B-1220]